MNRLLVLNPEQASEAERESYPVREAARGVVFDEENNIALLQVARKQYYKLPGGGLEDGEDKLFAFSRECKEEIGCAVQIVKELGVIVEYRKIFQLKQISYCYVAKTSGDKCQPDFTEEEKQNGFSVVWLPYLDALEMLKGSKATDIEGASYIVPRDITILEAIREYAM